jgi:hypothetical protein
MIGAVEMTLTSLYYIRVEINVTIFLTMFKGAAEIIGGFSLSSREQS